MPDSKPPVRTRRIPQPQDPSIAALRVDHERVYQAVDQRRRQQRMRWNEIAATFAVSPPTVTGWGRGIGLNADHLARALAWLDLPLDDFVTPEPAEPRLPVPDAAWKARGPARAHVRAGPRKHPLHRPPGKAG
jgi:hypothetical protein